MPDSAEGGTGSVGSDYGRAGGRAASVEIAELTHDDIRGQLSDYLDGRADAGQAARVAAHIRQCAACAAYLATLGATIDLLGALPTKNGAGALPASACWPCPTTIWPSMSLPRQRKFAPVRCCWRCQAPARRLVRRPRLLRERGSSFVRRRAG